MKGLLEFRRIPGKPYSIPFGGSFGAAFPPMQYSGKLVSRPRYEVITPEGSAGSLVDTQELGAVCSHHTAEKFSSIAHYLGERPGLGPHD
jgi:hypothetical protein